MRHFAAAFGVFLALAVTGFAEDVKPNTLSPEELDQGWILLFDGESLFGWKASSNANWKVADGILSASAGQPGLLCTTSQFGDYELKLDFRAARGCNSGVFLHTIPNPTRADLTTKCYEVNIDGSGDAEWPSGSIVDRQKPPSSKVENEEDKVIGQRRARIDQRSLRPIDPAAMRWQSLDITIEGGRLVVELDEKTVADYSDPKPLGRGPIGLQFRKGKIEFRNVKLRPLGLKSIFNGRDLSGWKVYPGMASEFSVTPEGWLHVVNGKGQLETAASYADFTFQFEAMVAGRGCNSGVFFRCIPGEFLMGYESQIHNGCKDNDRTKPSDCGTGGIFRRQNARKVVADDQAWFYETIQVDGPHVAVWVNGYQVTDWTDTRPPHENPRKGLRLEAGTIAIQGHDPTTDLMFRNLRIAELPTQ